MPLYEYQCTKCRKRTEKIENVVGPHLKKCQHCGGKVERLQSAPSIQFKGAGWYVTDYAAKKPSGGEGTAAEKSPEKDSAKETPKEPATAKDSTAKESRDKKPTKK